MKFPRNTQFTFGSLTFVVGEDEDHKMLPPGPVPEHPTLAPSTLGSTCPGLDPFAGLYIHTTKLVRGIPIVTSILQTFTRAKSSSSSASSPGRDSSNEYPEIGASACGKSVDNGHLIFMVAPNGDRSHNSSSGYPTIGRSERSNAQTPSMGLAQNLNPNFNVVRVQAIMETIQHMAPDGSPLALVAQQRAEAVNLIVAEKSASGPRRESSAGHNDRARHAQSEAVSSASPNQHLAENDVLQCISQNRNTREYGHNRDDLYNVIEDRRRIRDRTSSPPQQFLTRGVTPTGRSGFRALAGGGHSRRSGGRSSSRQATLINMTALAILKNLSRFIRPS
jgi:hypothetical protein